MESTRQKKVSRLIQKDLSEILQQTGRDLGGKLITVTVVRMSPDLSVAKIYLSIFPLGKDENPLEKIKTKTSHIRHELGLRVKNQLRIVPELIFYIDDSLDYIEKIDNILKK